jgi:hypothetical protein
MKQIYQTVIFIILLSLTACMQPGPAPSTDTCRGELSPLDPLPIIPDNTREARMADQRPVAETGGQRGSLA